MHSLCEAQVKPRPRRRQVFSLTFSQIANGRGLIMLGVTCSLLAKYAITLLAKLPFFPQMGNDQHISVFPSATRHSVQTANHRAKTCVGQYAASPVCCHCCASLLVTDGDFGNSIFVFLSASLLKVYGRQVRLLSRILTQPCSLQDV